MIQLRRYACAFCITFLFMVSCTDEYDYEYDGDLQFKILNDNTSGIAIEDSYILTIVTREIFNSVPNYLVTELEQSSDEISIHILSVDRSDAHYYALGEAIGEVPIEIFSGNDYSLKIHNGDHIDEYSFSIGADSISMVIIDTSFTTYLKYDEAFGS
ncbi:MAG: hypothetical protein HQ556_02865 [Candidatus Marinimicrobia bacterium]|nr:hypothetical protein [Candidatus Neomarinimicrobiota bacterium]